MGEIMTKKKDSWLVNLEESMFDFVLREKTIGANKSSTNLAVKNILRKTIKRVYGKNKK